MILRFELFVYGDQFGCWTLISRLAMSNFTSGGAEEKEPVIYVRYLSNASYRWADLKNDVDVSKQPKICGCAAKVSLPHCFADPTPHQSTTVVVGSKIYSFGGYDVATHQLSDQVSYIDTLYPTDGWKVCGNRMLRPQRNAYALTLNKDSVLVLGGKPGQCYDHTFTQMYYPKTDTWARLENNFDNPEIWGHAIVDEGSSILMHSWGSPDLFSYSVDTNRWDLKWEGTFAEVHTAAFVDWIYYVLDMSERAILQNLHFSGYDISLKSPKRLPVEVKLGRDEKDDEEWVPEVDRNRISMARLLSLGDSKLAMIWHYCCAEGNLPSYTMLSVWCSIFRMIPEKDAAADGGLKLVAHPLSNICYHLDGYSFESCLLVYQPKKLSGYRKRNQRRKMMRKMKMIEKENEKKGVNQSWLELNKI